MYNQIIIFDEKNYLNDDMYVKCGILSTQVLTTFTNEWILLKSLIQNHKENAETFRVIKK